jgi:N6-L-threonylcarbamoyladenine synthase
VEIIPPVNQNEYNYILGIETSCDETAASVFSPGKGIISSIISSQVELHSGFGGVVPEIASRKHLEYILPVTLEALQISGLTLKDIDAVSCAQGPGLVGALAVGWSFAKTIAAVNNLPFIGVNHTYSHLLSVFLKNNCDKAPDFPFIGLVVSGGHTSLYIVDDFINYKEIGRTRDDAAGEAFDKVAKILGLSYPGGPQISKYALKGKSVYNLPRARLIDTPFDFSFSGLKTAVSNLLKKEEKTENIIYNIAASFQDAVVDILCEKAINAAKKFAIKEIVISGGVSANKKLREKMDNQCKKNDILFYAPDFQYCSDNAAMTAFAGYNLLINGFISNQDEDVYSRNKNHFF